MKRLYQFSLLFVALLLPATSNAYQFKVDGIYYNIINGEASVTYGESYGSYHGNVTIPDSVVYAGKTFYVTSIGDDAFYNCYYLYSVHIPNRVKSIGKYAFSHCYDAYPFILPDSLVTIDVNAFVDTRWSIVFIPASVQTIVGAPFDGRWDDCPDADDYCWVTCPDGYTVDLMNPYFASEGNLLLNKDKTVLLDIPRGISGTINIPNTVKECHDYLYDLYYVSRINTNLKTWFEMDFQYAPKYYEIVDIYDDYDEYIGQEEHDFIFANNTVFPFKGDITIPSSVKKIGDRVFSGNNKLTSITIPNSVTSIGCESFLNCNNLTIINFPESVISISNSAFKGCSKVSSIDISNSVTRIGESAFQNCNAATNLTIGNSVAEIGNNAFQYCSSLTDLIIPSSVTSIGSSAFSGCNSLKDVYSYISDPSAITMGISVFYRSSNNYDGRTLHVPAGSLEAYQADTKWSQFFGNIVEMESENILATSVELDYESVELTEGDTLQLTATVMPEDATDKSVTWATSDEAVATVDQNGLVTALATGTATITATTNDGSELSATCVVNVTSPAMPPTVENQFVVTNISAKHGDVVVIPVALINSQTFAAFQTDVFLPEGFSIVTDEDDEYLVTPSERLTSDHVLMTNDANNGSVRVLCYTPNALPISGSEGELFCITVQVPDSVEGTYTIALRNSLLTTTEYQEISIPDAEGQMEIYAFIPGDVNDSRTVTVTDIVIAAQYVLDMNPDPFIFEAADMNGDGNVTVTDIMLIAYLINHPTMNAPKRMPALDGGNDRMSGEDVTLMAGETRTVSISLDNLTDYTAFQMDLTLPAGLTASNFQLTDRAGNHTFDVNTLSNGKTRALCYSPAIEVIDGHEGALLTFDVTATDDIEGFITVDGIELVTAGCQTVLMNSFTIGVNSATSVNELNASKTVARMDYFNLAGQQIVRPEIGVTFVVTTYTDGTRTTTKVIK